MSIQGFKRDRPTIGILTGWVTFEGPIPTQYRMSIVRGIQAAARNRQCHLLLSWGISRIDKTNQSYTTWPELYPETDFIPVGPWNTDGLIVLTPLGSQKQSLYLQELIAQGFPVLFIASGEQGPEISVNNQLGIHQAMAHLVEHGHRRIAFLAGVPEDKGDSQARLQAYHAALAEYGLDADPQLVILGRHSFINGYNVMRDLIGSGVKFTAVMASNDNSALGAMQAIHEAGLRIPQDIAIIGFDDLPGTMAQVPPLSSVHVPLNLIGEQALVLMADFLCGNTRLESVQIAPRLVKRQSCGCTPGMVSSAANSGTAGWPTPAHPSARPDLQTTQQQLINKMLDALPAELRFPDKDQIQQTYILLVEAFCAGLKQKDLSYFQTALMESIHKFELADASIEYWQEMLSILRSGMLQLPFNWKRDSTRSLAENMLHQARAIVAESAQRQDYRHQYLQDQEARALNSLIAQLSAELSEGQMIEILNSHLKEVGIQHARIMSFESQDDDPVAWSVVLDPQASGQRFASRQFPPPGLYPAGDLLNLILLPLVFQGEVLGYGAFEASNLGACAVIATQLAGNLKVAQLHAKVIELSLTDALTGLHNRRYFDLFLKNEIARSRRFSRSLSVIMVDIDHFKEYNDRFGHLAGDEALQQIARCLSSGRREADVVARIGGEEFAIILSETDTAGAVKVAEKVRTNVAEITDLKRQVTISLGVSELGEQLIQTDTLLGLADQALYQAKKKGRNRVCVSGE